MKQLFLASSIDRTAKAIAEQITQKTGKDIKTLKTAFITTGAEAVKIQNPDDMEWLENDRKGLADAGFDLFDYTITDKTPEQIEKDLGDCDVIHVNGGNSFYLLIQARKSGFDKFIRDFVNKGKIYTGSSAGSIIASPNIQIAKKERHKPYDEQLKTFEAFNLVNFIIFPHWASDDFKDEFMNERVPVSYVTGNKIILLTDTQYVLAEDDMYKIIDIEDK
jgi:dipeptidase E